MRKFYVEYPRNFANEYRLIYTENNEDVPASYEPISYKKAVLLCREEKERRKYNASMSGNADICIYPYGFDCRISPISDFYIDHYILKILI